MPEVNLMKLSLRDELHVLSAGTLSGIRLMLLSTIGVLELILELLGGFPHDTSFV